MMLDRLKSFFAEQPRIATWERKITSNRRVAGITLGNIRNRVYAPSYASISWNSPPTRSYNSLAFIAPKPVINSEGH